MAQFTIYSSNDASAPVLTGQAGALLTVLNACLVNGYGAKAAAGWSKPIADSGNCGHYLQGSGSGYHMFINDNGPNATSTYKEAWVTGWKTMTGIAAPVGAGSGQFPTPTQALTTGHLVCRKSASADAVGRQWIVVADSATCYIFLLSGDSTTATEFGLFIFGDFYSTIGSGDVGRCWIAGRFVENTAPTCQNNQDIVTAGICRSNTAGSATYPASVFNHQGQYTADSPYGGRGSYPINKVADDPFCTPGPILPFGGILPCPNPADQSIYMSPLFLTEPMGDGNFFYVRGRVRGLWMPLHPPGNFPGGSTFSGTGDFAGKTFYVIRTAGVSTGVSGAIFVEISNTVDTN